MSFLSALEGVRPASLVSLFADDPGRVDRFAFDLAGIRFDFSKTHLTEELVRTIDAGAYQAALPDTWFYRGLIRGLSTPEMPMVWMSFQVLSAPDVDRYWSNGCHILNATALMLGGCRAGDRAAASTASSTVSTSDAGAPDPLAGVEAELGAVERDLDADAGVAGR